MLRISNIFFRRTVDDLAKNELREAQEGLLQAQTGLEWAQAMVTYHQTRIARLNAYFEAQEYDKTDPETPDHPAHPTSDFPRWHIRGSY